MVITRTDRVSTVIARDETLIDVFVSLSPAFERLRRPGMRKVMARLVTVEQAARVAGVDAEELVTRLNAHGAAASPPPVASADPSSCTISAESTARGTATSGTAAPPDALARIPAERIVTLDVRDELRAGREPFSLIMAARRGVPDGGALCVRAIFEPVPLYAVMKRQGFDHWTERLDADDWRVWFHPPAVVASVQPVAADTSAVPIEAAASAEPVVSAPTDTSGDAQESDADVVILDVRGLEPPEPLMRTMAALEQLPAHATLLQINVRTPEFLLPLLEERGFTYHVREQEPGLVRVFIRHAS